MPRVGKAIALFVICAVGVEAHLTTLCASTSPSQSGVLRFWLGTYHGTASTIGNVYIYNQAGSLLLTSSFASGACAVNSQYPADAAAAIKSSCSNSIPSDAAVQCFRSGGTGSGTIGAVKQYADCSDATVICVTSV